MEFDVNPVVDGKTREQDEVSTTEDISRKNELQIESEGVDIISSMGGTEDGPTGETTLDTVTQVPCDVETPVTNREHSVNDVSLTTSGNDIAKLKEKISHLQVELRFMHRENDDIRTEQKEKLAELTESYEERIRGCEQATRKAGEKNGELENEINVLTTKYESKCNDVKTLEVAQKNLESLLQNKDEIIESQKLIIEGVRKQISESDGLKSK